MDTYEYIRMFIASCMIVGALTVSVAAEKPAAEPIDPASIDLTKPTVFIMPYTHLDDI